jgi:hypothetical protein
MKIGPRLSRLALALALGCTALGALAADADQFSDAEKLVFTDPQLANLREPTSLRYSFVKSGALEPGFEDEVRIDVGADHKVQGRFLTGPRSFPLPEVEHAEANPVILYFLERDISDMKRRTTAKSQNYFRTKIRMAMAEAAQVKDTRVTYAGKELPAREVTLLPYAKDPNRARYEKLADKRYVFVLAKDVPGGVYQLRTSLPGALPSDAPVMEEVLTLTGAEPGKAAVAASSPTKPSTPR